MDIGFALIGLDMPYRVIVSEDPQGFNGGDVNLYEYASGNPVNRIDPYGLFDNPLAKVPSFSSSFPNSKYIAPVADIVAGGIEGGFAVSLGVASAVGLVTGPENWWMPIRFSGPAVVFGKDAYGRISAGMNNMGRNVQ